MNFEDKRKVEKVKQVINKHSIENKLEIISKYSDNYISISDNCSNDNNINNDNNDNSNSDVIGDDKLKSDIYISKIGEEFKENEINEMIGESEGSEDIPETIKNLKELSEQRGKVETLQSINPTLSPNTNIEDENNLEELEEVVYSEETIKYIREIQEEEEIIERYIEQNKEEITEQEGIGQEFIEIEDKKLSTIEKMFLKTLKEININLIEIKKKSDRYERPSPRLIQATTELIKTKASILQNLSNIQLQKKKLKAQIEKEISQAKENTIIGILSKPNPDRLIEDLANIEIPLPLNQNSNNNKK